MTANRNELVTSLVEATLRDEHHLGDHTLVGAHTLTEDHNKGEVLFSIRNLRSWLPFYDGYLPILRRRVPFSASGEQSHFMLYELREAGPTSEYLAAERDPPVPRIGTAIGRSVHPERDYQQGPAPYLTPSK